MSRRNRLGFTLLELMLSLFLTTIVAVLMGGLIQLYLLNETRGRESVRQTQTARAILNMIAEDIRTTVRYQQFDTSGLQQMLSGASGSMGGGGGAAMGGGSGAGGGIPSAGGGASGGASPPGGSAPGGSLLGGAGTGGAGSGGGIPGGAGSGGAMSGGAPSGGGGASMGASMGSGSGGNSASSSSSTTVAVTPPGIFGSASAIEIDISRMPRPDEYAIQIGDISRGTLGDMPSDIKTVGYYVQAPRADGVVDPLAKLTAESQTTTSTNKSGMSGGLVRRSLDRAVTQFAYKNGRTDQLTRTGEIVAPEVLGVEFSYFNATSGWQTQWDSSQLGLPHVVKVTIAIQSESKSRSNPLAPGISLATINSGMISEYGIQIYSINVLIPGSALLSAPSAQSGTGNSSNGMGSLGL